MCLNYSSLREKDVINVCDGRKIGSICDLTVDADCGRITEIFVSDRFFGFSAQKPPAKIPWEKISCIGEDTILVSMPRDFCPPPQKCDEKKHKKPPRLFF